MVSLDKEKIITYEEPGCFGNSSTAVSCISLDYARELIRDANLEIQELYNQIAELSKSDITSKISLTKQHVLSTVATFTRLPYSKVVEYVEDIYKPDYYTVHYINVDGVWAIESAIKIKDCDLVTFVRNFKSLVDFGADRKLPMNRFNQLTQSMLLDFKKQNNLE